MTKVLFYILVFFSLFESTGIAQQQSSYVKGMYIHEGAHMSTFGDLHNVDSILYNDGHLTLKGLFLDNEVPISGSGTLEMQGNQDQHITSMGLIVVDSLILKNKFDVSYDNDIIINKFLDFENGILYDNYDLYDSPDDMPTVTFSATASHAAARDESHVDGLVIKLGRTRFVFPVGAEDYYRPLQVDNIDSSATISARYYYEYINFDEDELRIGVELFRDEFWYLSGGQNTFDVSLTYNDETSNFDPDTETVGIISFDEERDSRYRVHDAEPVSVASQLAYHSKLAYDDSSFVWYGLAFVDSMQRPSSDFYVPQVLSPNTDGRNDKFVISALFKYPDNKLLIFNRYGDLVYEMENYDNSWDGLANQSVVGGKNNARLTSGTYFVFLYNDGDLIYKDFVQLLRTD